MTPQDRSNMSPCQAVRNQPLLTEAHNINSDILRSGVLCLPGTVHMCEINNSSNAVTFQRYLLTIADPYTVRMFRYLCVIHRQIYRHF